MRVYRSNRLEKLGEAYARIVASPLTSPFARERLVVQSPGMGLWVNLKVAELNGVAANIRTQRPRKMIEELFAGALGQSDLTLDKWGRSQLTWKIAALLPELIQQPAFEPVRRYLEDGDLTRRVKLSQSLANLFDQYGVYRPAMVSEWGQGIGEDWQAILWRALREEVGPDNFTVLAGRFLEQLEEGGGPLGRLPSRISLFGMTTLPPLFLRILEAVRHHVDLHLFSLSPTPEYWADLRDRRGIQRVLRHHTPDYGRQMQLNLHLEQGNGLLAGWGEVGQGFQKLMEEWVNYQEADTSLYVEPDATTALGRLQRDVYKVNLREGKVRIPLDPTDRSLQIHGCHSPMREVEVLREQLLDCFETLPGLAPRDILVMTPDLSVHGPLIRAVFTHDSKDPNFIPYAISDRTAVMEVTPLRVLLETVALLDGRWSRAELLNLVRLEPVRQTLGLEEEDLQAVDALVEHAAILWGRDAEHRSELGFGALDRYTWREGLDRLLLGYSVESDGLVDDLSPVAGIEGERLHALSAVLQLHDLLEHWAQTMSGRATLEVWMDWLSGLASDLMGEAEGFQEELTALRWALNRLAEELGEVEFPEEIDLSALRVVLESVLQEEKDAGRFLRQGVTVCEMLPMRSIPFRVVVVLGLNDGAFPRTDTPADFDLMVKNYKPGDRLKRRDDQYLMLETLLSARDRLLLSYQSRNPRDNAERPPSTVLGQLLEVVDKTFEEVGDQRPSEHLTQHHPLHWFGERYLMATDASRWFSYRADHDAIVQAALKTKRPRPAVFQGELEASEVDDVEMGDLYRFFGDPVEWFLKKRLEVSLPPEVVEHSDRAPVSVDPLAEYWLRERYVELRLEGRTPEESHELLLAQQLLPMGALGEQALMTVRRELEPVVEEVLVYLEDGKGRTVHFEQELAGERRLHGELTGLYGGGRIAWSAGKIDSQTNTMKARIKLRVWIEHLCLQLTELPEEERVTRVIACGMPVKALPPMSKHAAVATLNQLVEWFEEGQISPLPFHPKAAEEMVKKKNTDAVSPLKKLKEFLGQRTRQRFCWSTLVGGIGWLAEDIDGQLVMKRPDIAETVMGEAGAGGVTS